MIAYDALLAAKNDWAELCSRFVSYSSTYLSVLNTIRRTIFTDLKKMLHLLCRAMFHAGDSDSTGVIAAAWFGGLYGFAGVPECNFSKLEYRERLKDQAVKLYKLSHP